MVEFRPAQITDIDALVDLRLRMFIDMGESTEGIQEEFKRVTRQYFEDKFDTDRLIQIVAEEKDQVVAVGILEMRRRSPTIWDFSGTEGYIYNMYTLPDFRRQGLATQIIEHLLRIAKQKGAKRVWLNATPQGRPIYEKAGFKAITRAMDIKLES